MKTYTIQAEIMDLNHCVKTSGAYTAELVCARNGGRWWAFQIEYVNPYDQGVDILWSDAVWPRKRDALAAAEKCGVTFFT